MSHFLNRQKRSVLLSLQSQPFFKSCMVSSSF